MGESREPVLELKGTNITQIRVVAVPYSGCVDTTNIFRFKYELVFDHTLSREQQKIINARIRPIREKIMLGLPIGDIADIKWSGKELSERLNQDPELAKTLLESADSAKNLEIQIEARDSTTVEIWGPWFTEPPDFLNSTTSPGSAVLEGKDKLFGVEIYDTVAKHVRELVNTSQ